jgi:thiol-disulfide isomerase/thioredoxin
MQGLLPSVAWLLAAAASLQAGDAAPAGLEMATPEGTRTSLAFGGQVTVVDFFATWCPPCRASLAVHEQLVAKHGDRVRIVVVDEQEPIAKVRHFFAHHPLPAGVSLLVDPFGAALEAFHPRQFPSFYVIDGAGKVRHVLSGWDDGAPRRLDGWIGGLVAKQRRAGAEAAR